MLPLPYKLTAMHNKTKFGYILSELFFSIILPFSAVAESSVRCGADRTGQYFPLLEGKHFALCVNQTSRIGNVHLADSLCAANLRPAFILSPEHGFRGDADAGAGIADSKDIKTGLNIVSLYGKQKKPTKEQLKGIDLIVFDLQDVGCRFYTYLSTLHYIIKACSENGIGLIVLDRPNPNDTVDGPLRKDGYSSFVGMHPIPVLHGCTLGEMARMILGEGWIKGSCDLTVITVEGWHHGERYDLPVAPSPNLPNHHAIALYPSLCLFEGTVVSVGRGTGFPFEVIGTPSPKTGSFTFTPIPTKGALHPLHEGKPCYGEDLRSKNQSTAFSLLYIMEMYRRSGLKEGFFSNAKFFDLLAGSDALRRQILEGANEEEIRQSWQADLNSYKTIRKKYLLYLL